MKIVFTKHPRDGYTVAVSTAKGLEPFGTVSGKAQAGLWTARNEALGVSVTGNTRQAAAQALRVRVLEVQRGKNRGEL